MSGTEPLSCTVSPIDSAAEPVLSVVPRSTSRQWTVSDSAIWTAPFRPFESQHLAFEHAHHPFNGG